VVECGEVGAVAEQGPVFNQINLVVGDMAAMVEFYERLGVPFRPTIAPWNRHHRTVAASAIVDGFDFDFDSQVFATQWDEGWPPGRTGPVLGFRVASAQAVDETYRDLTDAGYVGQQAPYDGFMGARYAVVADPDGNAVGLMSPIDPSLRTTPRAPDD
jgi:catechol 2,3-dioxygenase-like lactoylglutathione lyase family enzyme